MVRLGKTRNEEKLAVRNETASEASVLSGVKHLDRLGKERKVGGKRYEPRCCGVHLPTPWLFEPVKHPDDRADYSLENGFLSQSERIGLTKIIKHVGYSPFGRE